MTPTVITLPTPPAATGRKLYFDNNAVEDLLVQYVQGGCVSVQLRDEIMSHAVLLIQKVIKTHRLHLIYKSERDAENGDLNIVAWIQIERSLYKYKAVAHSSCCWNGQFPNKSCLYVPAHDEYGILTP